MADPAFHTPLVHEGILAVRGPDAAKFLQGQLTCNLAYLNDETSSLGGRCNIKGRLLSSFRILPVGDGLLLAMAGELLEAQLADLKKYAVFSKASLADEGDARVELWVPAQRAEAVLATLREHSREAPLDDWLLGQVRAGIGQVFGATRELFIPQMINLQAVGGVSFKKGCYTGQEIVARMQYLGRLKRRLYRLALDADEVPAPGTGLFSPVHSTSVGEVVLAARTPENSVELLAVLQDDAVADGRISLGSAEGAPLVLLNLPYTLDSDREIQR